jgi:flavodoxin
MKPIVIYASKSGNTKKIADAMATQLGCEAIRITSGTSAAALDLESYDLIFLGTGLYAGTPNEDLVACLKAVNLKGSKLFALFITWGGAPRSDRLALSKLKSLLENKSQKVHNEHFSAFGGWKGILMKRGHPKPDEIVAAGQWAKKVAVDIEKSV